jgi:hypothetical protein
LKEARRQNGIPKKHSCTSHMRSQKTHSSTSHMRSQKKHSSTSHMRSQKTHSLLGQICYVLRTGDTYGFVTYWEQETYMDQPTVYKILKQISQDIKKQQKFKETEENIFLQYYEKLWNITNTNVTELRVEFRQSHIRCTRISCIIKKNGKSPGEGNNNSEYTP